MWNATRRIETEWLDELAADDPRAVRSRRDLRRVNAWMLQAGIMARTLNECARPPGSLVDLGAGDGVFMLRVARALGSRWSSVCATLVDRQDIVSDETRAQFRALEWNIEVVAADAGDFVSRLSSPVDVITANLFIHHFPTAALTGLLARIASRTPVFVACEPRRAPLALGASRVLWAIGCNDVTRHDAAASVRAGFAGRELSAAWPRRDGWILDERPVGLFSHRFVARRDPQATTGTP